MTTVASTEERQQPTETDEDVKGTTIGSPTKDRQQTAETSEDDESATTVASAKERQHMAETGEDLEGATTVVPEKERQLPTETNKDVQGTTTGPNSKDGQQAVEAVTRKPEEVTTVFIELGLEPATTSLAPEEDLSASHLPGATTFKPVSVPAQKEIESRLLNTTEEFETTTQTELEAEDRATFSPEISADEPVEGVTSSPDKLIPKLEDDQVKESDMVTNHPEAAFVHETSTPVALAITLSPPITPRVANDSTGEDKLLEDVTTIAAEKEIIQTTTTATTRAEPKRISIGDILLGSTTESMMSMDKEATTLSPAVEEGTTEEATEFMYPMTEDETAKPEKPESSTTAVTTTTAAATGVAETTTTAEQTETDTQDEVGGAERSDTSTVTTTTTATPLRTSAVINGTLYEILEEVEATTAFDTVVRFTTEADEKKPEGSIDVRERILPGDEPVQEVTARKEDDQATEVDLENTTVGFERESPEESTSTIFDSVVQFITTTLSSRVAQSEESSVATTAAFEDTETTTSLSGTEMPVPLPKSEDKQESTTIKEEDEQEVTTTSASGKEEMFSSGVEEEATTVKLQVEGKLAPEGEDKSTEQPVEVTTQEERKADESEMTTMAATGDNISPKVADEVTTMAARDEDIAPKEADEVTTTAAREEDISGKKADEVTTMAARGEDISPKEAEATTVDRETENISPVATEDTTEAIEGREEVDQDTTTPAAKKEEISPKEKEGADDTTIRARFDDAEDTTAQTSESDTVGATTMKAGGMEEESVTIASQVKHADDEETSRPPSTAERAKEDELTTAAALGGEELEGEVSGQETTTASSRTSAIVPTPEQEIPESKSSKPDEEMTSQAAAAVDQEEAVTTTSSPTAFSSSEQSTAEEEATTSAGAGESEPPSTERAAGREGEEPDTEKPEVERATVTTTTTSSVLDLTTSKVVLVQESDDSLVIHTTMTPEIEIETTTVQFRIHEIVEESTTAKALVEGEKDKEDEKEFVMVEEQDEVKEESGKNQTLHTLKCHPTSEIPTEPGTIPMECQDLATSIEPIIVIISSEGLDLDYISKKNIKVVVKEFMLMDMQQQQTTMTTQQTPKRKK